MSFARSGADLEVQLVTETIRSFTDWLWSRPSRRAGAMIPVRVGQAKAAPSSHGGIAAAVYPSEWTALFDYLRRRAVALEGRRGKTPPRALQADLGLLRCAREAL